MITNQKTESTELDQQDRAMQIAALLNSDPLPMIQKSIDTFRRDLPALLKTHRGKWVAYHGAERIGFGKTQTDLYEECFRRGLTRDEFVVCGIEEYVFDPDEEIQITSEV